MRINMESDWFADPRREALARQTNIRSLREADGTVMAAWMLAAKYWGQGELIPLDVWDLADLQSLEIVKLAERQGGGVYVAGTKERAAWYRKCVERSKRAGEASAEARRAKDGTAVPTGARNAPKPPATEQPPNSSSVAGSALPNPPAPAPAPAPAPSQSLKYEPHPSDGARLRAAAEVETPTPTSVSPAAPQPPVPLAVFPVPLDQPLAVSMDLPQAATTRVPVQRVSPSNAPTERKIRLPSVAELMAQIGEAPQLGEPATGAIRDPGPALPRVVAETAPTVPAPEPMLTREPDAMLPVSDPFVATAASAEEVMRGLGLPLTYGLPDKRPVVPQEGTASAPKEFGAPALDPPAPQTQQKAKRAPKRCRGEENLTDEQVTTAAAMRRVARTAYSEAYTARYGTLPVMASKQNAQLKAFVDQVGAESPEVLRFYISHGKQVYTDRCHDLGTAVQDAPALRMQWATGRMVTRAGSQRDEVEAHNRAAILRVIGGGQSAG